MEKEKIEWDVTKRVKEPIGTIKWAKRESSKLWKDQWTYLNMPISETERKNIEVHSYIYGLLEAINYQVNNKHHGFIIITGGVGSGKSTIARTITAIWEAMHDRLIDWDNVCWTNEKFIEKTEREDNFTKAIWWDEAIGSISSRQMAISSQGEALKIALVTKRFKRHLYILLVDEIEEYSWKLIKMAQAWINVKTIGDMRGYGDVYTSKKKIKQIYLDLKTNKKMPNIYPDQAIRFKDHSELWFDEREYDKRKLKETNEKNKKDKEKINPKQVALNTRMEIVRNMKAEKIQFTQMAKWFNMTPDAISKAYRRWNDKNKSQEAQS